jgi:hypothetical protein
MKTSEITNGKITFQENESDVIFESINKILQTDEFDYDPFDWGKLGYLLELRRFWEKWVKKSETFRNIEDFFIWIRKFLDGVEGLNKYNLVNYPASSMLTFFIFVKLCGFKKVNAALTFLNKNKHWRTIIFGDKIPSGGTISSFKKKLGDDLNVYIKKVVSHLLSEIDFVDIKKWVMILFTKCSVGKVSGWLRAAVDVKRNRFAEVSKKISEKEEYSTNWSGFTLMLYVLYGFGISAILHDIPMKKENNAKYPPFKITLGIIISIMTNWKDSKEVNEKFNDEILLQIISGFDDGETPSKSTICRDIKRYNPEEVEKVFTQLIRWVRFLGMTTGQTLVLDSTKVVVNGKTYEVVGEGVDYTDNKRKKGYKIFVLYDFMSKVVLYFDIKPLNDSDCPTLREYIKKAEQIMGKNKIKKVYIDRGFYDEKTLVWLKKEHGIDFIIRGKKNTDIYNQAVESAKDYKDILIERENEYQPTTERGKKAKAERDDKKKLVKVAKVKMKMGEIVIEVVVVKGSEELSRNEKLVLLIKDLKKLPQKLYTSREILGLFKKKYHEEFSKSRNPGISIAKALNSLPMLKSVGKTIGKKYEIKQDYDIEIDAKLLGENEKETVNIWITTLSGKTPEQIIEEYRNRFSIEMLFRELKSEWGIKEFPSSKINAIKSYLFFTFMSYDIISIFKRSLTPEYRNMGIKLLRIKIFQKNSIVKWTEEGFKLKFNSKRYEKRYKDQLQSILSFIEDRQNEIGLLDPDT